MNDQLGLFENSNQNKSQSEPLAYEVRPENWDFFEGQKEIFKRYQFLKSGTFPSLILWGPPGTGKTTLANLLAKSGNYEIYQFNAVLSGVAELKKLIARAMEIQSLYKKNAIIFIDEIHRFNKAQQDALLPYVEKGSFKLIGATTENPRSCINRALISRLQIIELKTLQFEELKKILLRCSEILKLTIQEEIIDFIAEHSDGDARKAITSLETLNHNYDDNIDFTQAKNIILEKARHYDRNQDRHYDITSAYIKSMRGSDPDAALLYLAIMLDGGEDPVFIARRLIIFASEDIGNADPSALGLATAALSAVSQIGMPEARITLAQVTSYFASTVKSNAAYNGINAALDFVKSNETINPPDHLKNYPPKDSSPYQYPHNFPGNFIPQEYTNVRIPKFYMPTENGREKILKERLKKLWPDH